MNKWNEWVGKTDSPFGPLLANDDLIELKLRNGSTYTTSAERVDSWEEIHSDTDIVAWRFAEQSKATDNINQPSHYTAGKVECIDAIEAATTGLEGIEAVCTGNAIKYLYRWKLKNGMEDLKKARWYLDRLISKIEKES